MFKTFESVDEATAQRDDKKVTFVFFITKSRNRLFIFFSLLFISGLKISKFALGLFTDTNFTYSYV